MNIEELNKLEEKVNHMVSSIKQLRDENTRIKAELDSLKQESSVNSNEREQVKEKVSLLIRLIDSIETQ